MLGRLPPHGPRDPARLSCCSEGNRSIGLYALRRIIQANIDRFINLLKTETDPTRRAMETRLLADEEAKLKQLPPKKSDEKKAF